MLIPDNIKWAWFDLDNTLLDFDSPSHKALTTLYQRYGLNSIFSDCTAWIECYHGHNDRLWELYGNAEITKDDLRLRRFLQPLMQGGMAADKARELAEKFDVEYLELIASGAQLMPGALETVNRLRARGIKIGIITNGFTEVQYRRLDSVGLTPLVDVVVLSEEAGVSKPDPAIFDYAMHRAGTTPSESVMIGDNPATDIAGALNARFAQAILFIPSQSYQSIQPSQPSQSSQPSQPSQHSQSHQPSPSTQPSSSCGATAVITSLSDL